MFNEIKFRPFISFDDAYKHKKYNNRIDNNNYRSNKTLENKKNDDIIKKLKEKKRKE